jgi:hypothetical protein
MLYKPGTTCALLPAVASLPFAWGQGQANSAPMCNPPTQFFDQIIDHGSRAVDAATFKQQYQLITDNWQTGGPILLYISPQRDSMACGVRLATLRDNTLSSNI